MTRILVLALLILSAGPALARGRAPVPAPAQAAVTRPRVMMCELIDESGTGWVPEFVMFTRQTGGPQAGRLEVFDPLLQTLVRHPIEARVTEDTARQRTYGWALAKVRNSAGQFTERMDFRLTVQKADGSAAIAVVAQGYDNVMRGRGRCAVPE